MMTADKKLHLLPQCQASIDKNITSNPKESIKGINEIANSMIQKTSSCSSFVPGSFGRTTLVLTEEQAKREVGYLHKNMTEAQHASLAGLTSDKLICPLLDNPFMVEHTKKERERRGLDRVSRMRSNYSPINETTKI